MNTEELLNQFTIPTPCSMDWDRMAGDDRRRYCAACGKHVYNVSAIRPEERASLTAEDLSGDEELCGRLDLGPDGKLFPWDEPPTRPVLASAAQYTIRSLMMVIAACATILGITKLFLDSPEKPNPKPPSTTRPSRHLMGKMVPSRSVATPVSSDQY
jgi:hypothetical protein